MYLHRSRSAAFALVLLAMLALQLGCPSKPSLSEKYSTNIKKAHVFYKTFMEYHGMKGPKDEAELKEFLKTDATAKFLLKRIDVLPENVDGFFISDRDGEPFEIRYGVNGEADHALVFEKTGVDGKRLVAFSVPRELDNEEYEKYLAGKVEAKSADQIEEEEEAEG